MSNKLEDLVPPLELCRKIPAGEFEDSALVWIDTALKGMTVFVNSNVVMDVLAEKYPAPTLQEIMEVLPHDDAYNDLLIGYSAKVDKLTGWHIYYNGERKRHCYDKSAVTAALKLWLEMKGIEA